jgi:hypothetical protein
VEFISLALALLSDVKYRVAAIYLFGGRSLRPTYGHKKDKNMHNEKGNFHLPKGSLYSPFPIPAYQVLGRAGEYQAQKVLLALVSFMGKSNNAVFPSYTTISKSAGMSRNSIRPALDVLHEYGFLKSVKYPVGKQARSKYFIQFACWDTGRMNALAKPHKKLIARCLACGNALDRGDFAFSPLGKVHWGCGGEVIYLPSYRKGRK